jgi:hypothetical protein
MQFIRTFFLNDTNIFIKNNLQNIIDGKFDDKFGPDHLKMVLELSFLFNHTKIDKYYIIFEYNGVTLKINAYESHRLLQSEEEIISFIRNEETFKSCYNSFLRDVKINQIIKDDEH